MESKIPKHISKLKEKIIFTNEGIKNPNQYEHAASFASMKIDNSANIKTFMDNIAIEINEVTNTDMNFDIKGIDAPIANALRRIIIAEIPTMAIEKINLYQNTSIIPDEVLVHRLGLIPINVDPRLFIERTQDGELNEDNCLKFKLHIKCMRKPAYKNENYKTVQQNPELYLDNTTVYSGAFQWEPVGNQKSKFENKLFPQPVHNNIIIAKLREYQEIEAELICEKGIGKTHAKWSPVSTAFYRLMPDIEFSERILNEMAENLKAICPMSVFDIEETYSGGKTTKEAVVKNVRNCTMCRECIREEHFASKIELGKKREHYIFTIESVGIYSPKDLFLEAIKILKQKANSYDHCLDI